MLWWSYGSFKTCIKFLHVNDIPSFMENNPHAYTYISQKNLWPTTGVWDLFSNSLFNLFIKVQGNLKDQFIETSSQIVKQIKSSGKPSEHTISQSGKANPWLKGL
jgi:hypothetical protein